MLELCTNLCVLVWVIVAYCVWMCKWCSVYVCVCVKIHTQCDKLEVVFLIGECSYVANFATVQPWKKFFVSLCTCVYISGTDYN